MDESDALRRKIEELAHEWEIAANSARKYATYPKSSGIDTKGSLFRAAHLDVSAEKLRRALAETAKQ